MDRAPSAGSNSAARARSLSNKTVDSRCATPTLLSLFVRNLRLLNLDSLPDWPDISTASFTTDARTKIRCAEWALYHLFRLFDPATTVDKLRPFFPPLEPLQSINLRAALYRCLNESKKNGDIGRETVLRKSLLDECNGEKFWELCVSFSTLVLRKVTFERSDSVYDRPLAEHFAAMQSVNKFQRDSMLPLAIAHKASLSKLLADKDRKRLAYAKLLDLLMDKEEDLQQRQLQAQEKWRAPFVEAAIAEGVLAKDWVASDELRQALQEGDDTADVDSLLTRSFDAVWDANNQNQLFSRPATDKGLLEDLDTRARNQRRRLQKWQSFHEELLANKPPSSSASQASSQDSQLCFDRHQNLTLQDMADIPPPLPSPSRHQKHDSVVKYDGILSAMREELRKKSAASQAPDPPSPERTPRARRSVDHRQSASQNALDWDGEHHRSLSQTAVPVRPHALKRLSLRSRSYQQPKVVSQREPIPLKSEIFSPLKTHRNSTSPASSGRLSILASPLEDPSACVQNGDAVMSSSLRHRQDSSSSIGFASTSTLNNSGASTPRSSSDNHDSAVDISYGRPLPIGPFSRNVEGGGGGGGGRSIRPTLADRTRMSMAFKSSDDVGAGIDPDTMNHFSVQRAETPGPMDNTLERRASAMLLLDRTRQSMLLSSPTAVPLKIFPPRKSSSSRHTRSRTSTAFPVNQFETPEKQSHGATGSSPRRSTLSIERRGGTDLDDSDPSIITPRRSLTPRDELFAPDADYASIFKPRPKVALSPLASPSTVDPDLDNEHAGPSPLASVQIERAAGIGIDR